MVNHITFTDPHIIGRPQQYTEDPDRPILTQQQMRDLGQDIFEKGATILMNIAVARVVDAVTEHIDRLNDQVDANTEALMKAQKDLEMQRLIDNPNISDESKREIIKRNG